MRLRIINQELLIFYEKMGKIAVLSSFFIFISIMPFAAYAKVNQLTIPTGVGSSDDSSCLVIKRVELMNIDAFPNAGRLIQWTKQA
ncbi:TPA: ShlB/FhaC/HecB family hemolysin secretion/activation protein, partial [Yersinia enterocolitica]